jgi:hypothetical protein
MTGTAGVRARKTADLVGDERADIQDDDPAKTFDGGIKLSDVLQSDE